MTRKQIPVTVEDFDHLYVDDETGKAISTHSMLKTFKACPQQAYYKYVLRLKPKVLGRPLRFGTWMHSLLEAHYKGEDWKEKHKQLTNEFSKLFDEEKEAIGDLPRDCYYTMLSYLWHYKDDPWKVHEVEFTLEVELPDGAIYRGRIDMLVENQYGLWIVDHKNHKTLPDLDYRILDAQSALYIWAALKSGIPVQGHIWNYIRSKAPSTPELLKSGTRLSKRKCDSDFPTYYRAIKHYGLDPADYAAELRRLKAQRYAAGEMQTSSFFRRDILEKSPGMLKRVATEAFMTHKRMRAYHWDRVDAIERNVGNQCKWMCSYRDICTMELFGGNAKPLIRQKYEVGDPMDYYYDDKPEQGKDEG